MMTIADIVHKLTDNKLTRMVGRAWSHSIYVRRHNEAALAEAMRAKERVRIVFILTSLTAWKTESLYRAMAAHPRFEPQIAVCESLDRQDTEALRQYLTQKGYPFAEASQGTSPERDLKADIVFYQKPYPIFTERGALAYWRNPGALTCYVDYAFHTTETDWNLDTPFLNEAWMVFFENKICVDGAAKVMRNEARNSAVTGLPFQDELMAGMAEALDPWKPMDGPRRKRIIYAPHHSIDDDGGLNYSTFLETGETMLDIAREYADRVQFAFKPHPLLRAKLEKKWGKKRTDEYYGKWAAMANCQMETGKYIGLFAHSDAMIHDCSSFIVEYHYTRRPALYLVKEGRHSELDSAFARKAFDLHYKAHCEAEIRDFIDKTVIMGEDSLKPWRDTFYAQELTPPGGRTACENIIGAILGTGE